MMMIKKGDSWICYLLKCSLVQSILLYNAETWTLKEERKRSIRVFKMLVVRKILGCTRRDHRWNIDVIEELSLDKDIIEFLRTYGKRHLTRKNVCLTTLWGCS